MRDWLQATIVIPIVMTWRQYEAYQRCIHDESSDPEDPPEARRAWCFEIAQEQDVEPHC